MNIKRIARHLLTPHWVAMAKFRGQNKGPHAPLIESAIENAIAASEKSHDGEIRFVAEAGLHPLTLWRGLTVRQRTEELFASLRVWDTAHNSGVLIYVQLIDRRIEIVADRGIAARVAQVQWDAICLRMEAAFRAGQFEAGSLAAIAETTALLARHFPPQGGNPNELSDKPVVL